MKTLLFLILALPQFTLAAETPALPAASTRAAMLRELAHEMIRVDGEGLIVREGRPSQFTDLALALENEAEQAQTWPDFLLALKRLDLAYPNLHAYLDVSKELPPHPRVLPKVGFSGEWLSSGLTRFRINRVDQDSFPVGPKPEIGDTLVAINGKSIGKWKKEHFDFCKWALPEQCDLDFPSDFYNEFSGWTRKMALTYTLQRGDLTWTVPIELRERGPRVIDDSRLLCANFPQRYAGFHLVHGGKFACIFAKDNDPSTLLLRITSFQYHRSSNQEGARSPQEEVDAFWPYWEKRARDTKHLLIDLSDNGGGNQPTPYYEVFFNRPYQEQWVRFKKIRELEDPVLRRSMFWRTEAQEIWFQNLQKKEGVWDATPYGEFLPRVPMFCAIEDRDCREGLFSVRDPGFRGKVSLIVNQGCVSSCDGFVYSFKQELAEQVRIYGQPQAADTAYSRIRIGVELDAASEKGFRLRMLPQYGDVPPEILFSQVTAVTRSVTREGTVVSGKPLPVDRFIPNTLENESSWHMEALISALAQ